MKQYIKTAQQNRLLSLLFDTSTLTLLRSRTGSCIQMISFKGIQALKSIQDSNRKIRIVLISLLTKIHLHYTPQNKSRLSTLKNIIYNSRQESITQQKGIVRQQLLKMMAQQITSIEIRNDVQIQILKMFNNIPFFDDVLINAIKEANPLICDNDCQIAAWLDRQLEIKVNINQDALIDETQGEMYLVGLGEQFHASKDCKCSECKFKGFREYMRFSSQICTTDFDNQTHKVYDRKTRGQMFSRLIFQEQPIDKPIGEVNQNLYDTVLSSSIDLSNSKNNSPNTFSKTRKNKQPQSVGLFDSAISQTMDQKKDGKIIQQNDQFQVGEYVDSEYEDGKKTIKVKRRSKKNKQGSALWNILCCNF